MFSEPVEIYVREVTKGMGIKQRKEVARELKSHILDSADELAAQRNVKVDDAIIKEVISRMGPAEKVAEMYHVEETVIDRTIFAVKVVGLFTFIFIVVVATFWTILKIYVKTLEFSANLLVAVMIVYLILLAIYLFFRLKVPTKIHKKLHEKLLKD